MAGLKPCPFCGGGAEMRRGASDGDWFVACKNGIEEEPIPDGVCGAEGRIYESEQEAAKWWNTRPVRQSR